MNFLFVHQSFPGQYWHIVRLLRDNGHRVVFLTCPTEHQMRGVTKVEHAFNLPRDQRVHPGAQDYDVALRRADVVAGVMAELKQRNFRPDIILGHHGWGDLLNVQDVWPDVPLLGYFEYYYAHEGREVGFDAEFGTGPEAKPSVRARNAINHLALTNPGAGQCPTEFQLATYPEAFQSKISLIREGIDLQTFSRNEAAGQAPLDITAMIQDPAQRAAFGQVTVAPGEKLVTHVNAHLEPCRGLHIMMRALPGLLARRDVRVVIVGSETKGYGPTLADGRTWKQYFLQEMRGHYDESRVHFVGNVSYADYRNLLRRSDAHVYLTYPFVASWSLREALACGCAVIGSDTVPVREFIRHGWNGLLTPFFNHDALSERILELFEDGWLDGHLRANARAFAEKHLSMAGYLSTYWATISGLVGGAELAAGAREAGQ
ncbi:MAG: glycosyltransferase [Acidisphaera sp.]|nr:glycosyltransferase [Acidisphaera sp.]